MLTAEQVRHVAGLAPMTTDSVRYKLEWARDVVRLVAESQDDLNSAVLHDAVNVLIQVLEGPRK